jgi:hypothetical protein
MSQELDAQRITQRPGRSQQLRRAIKLPACRSQCANSRDRPGNPTTVIARKPGIQHFAIVPGGSGNITALTRSSGNGPQRLGDTPKVAIGPPMADRIAGQGDRLGCIAGDKGDIGQVGEREIDPVAQTTRINDRLHSRIGFGVQ